MNARFLLSSALFLVLASPGASFANPSMAGGGMGGGMGGKGAEASFTRMDADNNGKATREEFFAAFPQMKEGAFTTIDKDADGVISKEEWLLFSKGHAADESAAHPEGMGQTPAGGMNGTAPAGKAPDLIMPPK